MKRKIFFMCIIFIFAGIISFGQDEINLLTPRIYNGNVVNDSFYTGPISIECSYTGENPFMGWDKKAYYSLNARTDNPDWFNASIEEELIDYDFPLIDGMQTVDSSCTKGFDDGRTVIVWKTLDETGYQSIHFQLLDADGNKSGGEIRANSLSNIRRVSASKPDVAIHQNGNFIIVWDGIDTGNSNVYKVYGRLYDTNGTPLRDIESELNFVITTDDNFHPSVMTTEREIITVWATRAAEGSDSTSIEALRYDYDGALIDKSVLVEKKSTFFFLHPQIARLNEREYILLYGRVATGIFIQKLILENKELLPTGPEITITVEKPEQKSLKIEPLKNNGFVVTWSQSSGTGVRLYGKHFNNQCQAMGERFQIDSHNDQTYSSFPHISASADGGFVVIWRDYNFREKQGAVMIKRFSPALDPVYESVVKEKNSEITAFGACATTRNRIMFVWTDKVDSVTYQRKAAYFTAGKRAYTPGTISPEKDIDIRFKLVAPVTSEEWLSPVRSYRNANPGEGADSTIYYPGGFTTSNNVKVQITPGEGRYKKLEFFRRIAVVDEGRIGPFEGWEPYGTITSQTREVDVSLREGYAYQFKYNITNISDIFYEITSDTTLVCDLSGPDLRILEDEQDLLELRLFLEIEDTISGIGEMSYQINNGDLRTFFPGELVLTLDEGLNHIILEALDKAGNRTISHLFKTAENIVPGIRLNGIEEGAEYGDNLAFSYTATVQLIDAGIYVDDNFVGSAGAPVVHLDLSGYNEGWHKIAVRGKTPGNDWLEGANNFFLKHGTFNLVLLSPQDGRQYGTRNISIAHWTSIPAAEVWYLLDGEEVRDNPELTGLEDGNHELVLFVRDTEGRQASVSANFSIKEVFPELNVLSPVDGKVYPGSEIKLIFGTNAEVSYTFGEEEITTESGAMITVPDDGEYVLTMTASHPVSGNTVRKSIAFTVDSIEPELKIFNPESRLYGNNEINIDYSVNKTVKEAHFFLDGEEVDDLSDLDNGAHRFKISILDHAGRLVEKGVDFTVSHLEIIKPADGTRIVSEIRPPAFSLVYDQEGSFDALTRSLDESEGELITDPPGVEIPMETEAGGHELYLRGYRDEFLVTRRSRFQIGRKNLSVNSGSINYRYERIGESEDYDVDIFLTIENTGDLDVDEPVQVRFDSINSSGYVDTYRETIESLAAKEKTTIELYNLTAHLGDHFLVTIDPDNSLSGDYPGDNCRSIEFQAARITGITQALPEDNVYLQDVSLFNTIEVDTAGSVAYVEFHTNSKVFIDDTMENGFRSLVDMGLLSPEKNYVRVLIYGYNGVVLDSRKIFFNIKSLNQGKRSHIFPWAQFTSGNTGTSRGTTASRTGKTSQTDFNFDPGAIIMEDINVESLAVAQSRAVRNSLLSASTIIPVIEDGKKVYYMILALENSLNQTYEALDIDDVPILSGSYNLPNGKGFISITSFDPAGEICISTGAIPILDGGMAYVDMINNMWQDTINSIDQMFEESIDLDEILEDMVNTTLSDLDWMNWRIGNLFFINYDFYPNLLGAFFFGFLDYSIEDRLRISASELDITAGFEAEACLVCREPGNIFSGFDVEAQAKFNLRADTDINISTPGLKASFFGIMGVRFLRFIYVPLLVGGGSVRIHKQNLHIPINLELAANLYYTAGTLNIVPAHAQLRLSCHHNNRLATGNVEAYLIILPILGVGADIKADLKIDAAVKADLILSMKPDFIPELHPLYYADGEVDVDIHVDYKMCINFGLFKVKFKVFSDTYNIHQEGEFGEDYTAVDVQTLLDEGTMSIGG